MNVVYCGVGNGVEEKNTGKGMERISRLAVYQNVPFLILFGLSEYFDTRNAPRSENSETS